MRSETQAGDYQCLAQYGASVVASVPGRITIATFEPFPKEHSAYVTVSEGNTIIWWCDVPFSNPPAFVDYYRNDSFIPKDNLQKVTQSLILHNVTRRESGQYRCQFGNNLLLRQQTRAYLHLQVVSHAPKEMPRLLWPQKKNNYTVTKGLSHFYVNRYGRYNIC